MSGCDSEGRTGTYAPSPAVVLKDGMAAAPVGGKVACGPPVLDGTSNVDVLITEPGSGGTMFFSPEGRISAAN